MLQAVGFSRSSRFPASSSGDMATLYVKTRIS
jgi:hypothetical protein